MTALTLSLAIKKLEDIKVVLCGLQAIDGDTGQVCPELAQCLRMPQITYVEKMEVEEKKIVAHRQTGEGYAVIESKMPVLLTLFCAIQSLIIRTLAKQTSVVQFYKMPN